MSRRSKLLIVACGLAAACAGGPSVDSDSGLVVGRPGKSSAAGAKGSQAPRDPSKQAPRPTGSRTRDTQASGQKTASPGTPGSDAGAQGTGPQIEYDEVLAIVGPEVVTRRQIHQDVQARLVQVLAEARRKNPKQQLDADTIRIVERQLVQEEVRDFLLADHVNSLGIERARIDAFVEQQLRKSIRKNEAEAGSSLELLERLRSRGLEYGQFVEQERRRIRRQIAISEEFRKARANSPLLATPKEMLAYYRSRPEDFRIKASATVSLLRFAAIAGQKTAHERALAARKSLSSNAPIAEVEKAQQARLQVLEGVVQDGAVAEVVRRFAFADDAEVGRLSAPVQVGSELWLMRLDKLVRGGMRAFLDREVQAEIRQALTKVKRNELFLDIERQERRRIQVWPRDLFGG